VEYWRIRVYTMLGSAQKHGYPHLESEVSRSGVWTPDQILSVQKWGNRRANLYWEAHLKPGHVPPDHKVDSFIRSKYDGRRWAMEGPVPDDPSVLEEAPGIEVKISSLFVT